MRDGTGREGTPDTLAESTFTEWTTRFARPAKRPQPSQAPALDAVILGTSRLRSLILKRGCKAVAFVAHLPWATSGPPPGRYTAEVLRRGPTWVSESPRDF